MWRAEPFIQIQSESFCQNAISALAIEHLKDISGDICAKQSSVNHTILPNKSPGIRSLALTYREMCGKYLCNW
jgi:hypothetical protein